MFQKSNTPKKTSDVRKATMADLPQLIALFRAFVIQMGYGGLFNESCARAELVQCLRHDLTWVQEHDGSIVGTLMCFRNTGGFQNRVSFGWETLHWLTLKKYSGRCRARALTDAARHEARWRGRTRLYLHLMNHIGINATGRIRHTQNSSALCRFLKFHSPAAGFYEVVPADFVKVGSTLVYDPLKDTSCDGEPSE